MEGLGLIWKVGSRDDRMQVGNKLVLGWISALFLLRVQFMQPPMEAPDKQ